MIFHSTWKDRVVYLMVLGLCIGLVGFTGFMVLRGAATRVGSWKESFGVSGILLALAIFLHGTAWSVTIRVHDGGLDWKDGNKSGSLAWSDIQGIGFKRYPKFVKPGLVMKSDHELRFLPFFSPKLYAAIRERCGRLPAEVERELGFRI